MFGTDVGIGMPTAVRLRLTVQRMQWSVEYTSVFHSTYKSLIMLARKFRQPIFNPLKVSDIRPHQGFPEFAVVGNPQVKQFVDDDVILRLLAQQQNIRR